MKRKLILWTVTLLVVLGGTQMLRAEDKAPADSAKTTQVAATDNADDQKSDDAKADEEPSFVQVIKTKIIDGGVAFMSIVLLCLILGLTVAIEKVIVLNLSSTNIPDLLSKLKGAVEHKGLDGAREMAATQQGPVASVIAQSLLRADEGIESIEKSIEAYGSAEVTKLERGMSWISLFISLAPMFGFLGTVIGMITAFGTIKNSADIKIAEIAGGIETALLTTAAGLVVAAILQVFYNYCQAKIEDLTSQLEDGSNGFMNLVVTHKKVNG